MVLDGIDSEQKLYSTTVSGGFTMIFGALLLFTGKFPMLC